MPVMSNLPIIESRLSVYDAVLSANPHVTQFRSSHVASSSRVPTSGVGKDGPQDSYQRKTSSEILGMKFGRKRE